MAGYFKWLFAVFAFYLSGEFFVAAIAFFIGAQVDSYFIKEQAKKDPNYARSRGFSQRTSYDFQTALLGLSAVIMKADSRVMKSELNYVKSYLRQQFGNQFTNDHLLKLKEFLDQPHAIPVQQICYQLRIATTPEVRVQILHFLFGIAKADGNVSSYEINQLQRIAHMLGIPNMDFTSVENMFHRDTDSDYKVLGVTKDATDNEVKKAYRQMAIRFHPDKVASMGEEYQQGAKEKFQKVQEAYENIKKERGM